MMSQPRLAETVHNEICKGRIFVNHTCKECGRLVDHNPGHIEIGVGDKIPLKGQ